MNRFSVLFRDGIESTFRGPQTLLSITRALDNNSAYILIGEHLLMREHIMAIGPVPKASRPL